MRLLTHNLLACVKCQSFPLSIQATSISEIDSEYDPTFVRRMLPRINYDFLLQAYNALRKQHENVYNSGHELPASLDDMNLGDDSAHLRAVNYALNVIAVKDGKLCCTECGRAYVITEFIPNFVLQDSD